jgi:hypothetical protein
MSASRSLIGIVQDIDLIGISTLRPDWHLNEFDDFGDEDKLSIQITGVDGLACQIIDYALESAAKLKPEVIHGRSIVSETIYESARKFFLKQTIKMDGETCDEVVELTKTEKNELGIEIGTHPIAVALSQGDNKNQSNTHHVWVLSLSAPRNVENPEKRLLRKPTICSLKLQGWACQYKDSKFTLVEQTINTTALKIELDCSLDSATEIGLGATMVVVGSGYHNPNSIDKIRLVATINSIKKGFIFVLSSSPSVPNTWFLEGVEWQLPKSREQSQNLGFCQDSYKLRVVSTFVPKHPDELEGSYVASINAGGEPHGSSEISQDRVGIYWQGQAEDIILAFKSV